MRWLRILVHSAISIRIQVARSGTSRSICFSTIRATPSSLATDETQSCRLTRAMIWRKSRYSASFSKERCM
jgi:hypothetical protein